MILLNPGPVTLSTRVREALLQPDICHREPEFYALQDRIRADLLKVYELDPREWAAILLTGSGTAAVEAMITSLVPKDGHLLVIENGVYGERMTKIAATYGIPHDSLKHTWNDPPDLAALSKKLKQKQIVTHVALAHHETTTGRLNPLREVQATCAQYGVSVLVDGVSSFGAEAIDFDPGIAVCAATANKCLHGVPGISFAIVRRSALADSKRPVRSVYLDLSGYCEAQDQGGTPFTQSVQVMYALAEALQEMQEQGGWQARHAHYAELMRMVRNGLAQIGIQPLLADGDSSVVLNAFKRPEHISYETLHDGLKEQGFVIYAGQGALAASIFRVAVMGAITPGDMARFVAAAKGLLWPSR